MIKLDSPSISLPINSLTLKSNWRQIILLYLLIKSNSKVISMINDIEVSLFTVWIVLWEIIQVAFLFVLRFVRSSTVLNDLPFKWSIGGLAMDERAQHFSTRQFLVDDREHAHWQSILRTPNVPEPYQSRVHFRLCLSHSSLTSESLA